MKLNIVSYISFDIPGNRIGSHDFTGDVIKKAYYDAKEFITPTIKEYIVGWFSILLGTFGNTEIARIFSIMINNRHAQPFDLISYMNNEVPAGSLIIFATPADLNGNRIIQHSMIKVENDTWIGVDNLKNLGILNSIPIISETLTDNPTGVFSYPLMSLRTHIPPNAPAPAGGWGADSKMKSITGEPYEMFYMPIF